MKKLLSISVAMLLLISAMMPMIALASPDEMVVAHLNVPNDWEEPCLWAWNDEGQNAFNAWPGGEAEADPDNDGWYYCYLPNWATNIIVNANGGTVQTDVLVTTGEDFWVTVVSPEEANITYDALTIGTVPEYVEKINVYANVPTDWENPHVWAWLDPDGTNAFAGWPGGEMKGPNDYWYSLKVPNWINSIIINANDGAVQTTDFKNLETGQDIWVVVEDDGTAKVYHENPDLMEGPTITVRVAVPADWNEPNLWAWLDGGASMFGSWPGEPFLADDEWYELTVPGWADCFIINANDGAVQTGDMTGIETGRDLWIVITDATTYTWDYEEIDLSAAEAKTEIEPAPEPEPEPEPEPTSAPSADPPTDETGSATLWIILGIVAIIAAGCGIMVMIRKKK